MFFPGSQEVRTKCPDQDFKFQLFSLQFFFFFFFTHQLLIQQCPLHACFNYAYLGSMKVSGVQFSFRPHWVSSFAKSSYIILLVQVNYYKIKESFSVIL